MAYFGFMDYVIISDTDFHFLKSPGSMEPPSAGDEMTGSTKGDTPGPGYAAGSQSPAACPSRIPVDRPSPTPGGRCARPGQAKPGG